MGARRLMLNNDCCLRQTPCVQMAPGRRQLLIRSPRLLDVWQLGAAAPSHEVLETNTYLKLSQEPFRVLHLKAKDDEWIICASISFNGDYIAYATESRVYIHHFIQVFCCYLFIFPSATLFLRNVGSIFVSPFDWHAHSL